VRERVMVKPPQFGLRDGPVQGGRSARPRPAALDRPGRFPAL